MCSSKLAGQCKVLKSITSPISSKTKMQAGRVRGDGLIFDDREEIRKPVFVVGEGGTE